MDGSEWLLFPKQFVSLLEKGEHKALGQAGKVLE